MADAENIRMTVVINPLISPMLFDALSGCRSARERAARFKALAESALRQQLAGRVSSVSTPDSTNAESITAQALTSPPDDGLQALHVSDSTGEDGRFATGSLCSELAGLMP